MGNKFIDPFLRRPSCSSSVQQAPPADLAARAQRIAARVERARTLALTHAKARTTPATPPANAPPATSAPRPPNLAKVGHYVHSALALSSDELLILRRYVRLKAGELAPESTLSPLPALPTPPPKTATPQPAPKAPARATVLAPHAARGRRRAP